MLSDADMHERMVNGWRAGRPFTVCGNGSLRENSRLSRAALPVWTAKYGIQTVCDAGAGDLFYIEGVDWSVDYLPFDLIPRRSVVTKADITVDALPECDAILCRMVLNHLDRPRIEQALTLFRQSAKYLIATQFNGKDLPQRSPQFARLDLMAEPYGLGEPLERVQDGSEPVCSLALWKL